MSCSSSWVLPPAGPDALGWASAGVMADGGRAGHSLLQTDTAMPCREAQFGAAGRYYRATPRGIVKAVGTGGCMTNAIDFPVLLGSAGRFPVARRARGRGRVLAPPTYLPVSNRVCGQEANGIGGMTGLLDG